MCFHFSLGQILRSRIARSRYMLGCIRNYVLSFSQIVVLYSNPSNNVCKFWFLHICLSLGCCNKVYRLGGFNIEIYFFIVLAAGKSKIKMLSDLFFVDALFLVMSSPGGKLAHSLASCKGTKT